MTILLAFFYFFYFAIIGIYIIFMPEILAKLGYSAIEIGVIFASMPLVKLILPFAFTKGLKLDSKSVNIALVMVIVGSISFYSSLDDFYRLLMTNIILGIGLGMVLPYMEVIALDVIGKQRYGKVRLFGSLGFVLVALVLVKFLSSPDIALNYLLVSSLSMVGVAFFIVKNSKQHLDDTKDIKNDIDLLADWKLWAGLTLMQVSFGAFYNFFTIYESDYGVSLDMIVYLWSFGVLAEIVMLFFQGNLLKGNLLTILQVTTFMSAVRWFLIFLYPQNLVILFLAQTLHALSFALFHSAAISYLFHHYKHRSLAQQFFSGITYGLGGFVGALYAGFVYESYSTYLFLSATFLALMASFFIYLWSVRTVVKTVVK